MNSHLPLQIVISFPGYINFEIRGERIQEMLTQELVELAQLLALHPELIPWVDVETMEVKP